MQSCIWAAENENRECQNLTTHLFTALVHVLTDTEICLNTLNSQPVQIEEDSTSLHMIKRNFEFQEAGFRTLIINTTDKLSLQQITSEILKRTKKSNRKTTTLSQDTIRQFPTGSFKLGILRVPTASQSCNRDNFRFIIALMEVTVGLFNAHFVIRGLHTAN